MTLVHIVLFKFRSNVSEEHKQTFVTDVTDPIERSKGFQIAPVSYHENREVLAEYQASDEHRRVTLTYMFPYKEDLVRFDFEVDEEDEYMCQFPLSSLGT
ncbi:stress responsive A/B barrel domain protein [Aspergillus nomiae NRRL 13137]|uniref:Stress responsive A/B barrel domain protein n=1 Tax=Aspergillus nomiae NRRL (strain ATCC 15546 / NRRL 13137 / CBS 260.88 / M93) TaxID=1509407 RepID=A0A0L1JIX4_ASPN3|nr:stress responsive A/B barrel domain protein [Aspergillus nomiae NRRL 13137]KNG91343.1 stress responsive A/B barrel domain protein [Aspergillus nomiae NRRL 13137]